MKSKVSKSVISEHGVLEFFVLKSPIPLSVEVSLSIRNHDMTKFHSPSESHDSDRFFLNCFLKVASFLSFKIQVGVFAKMKLNVQITKCRNNLPGVSLKFKGKKYWRDA